jgi:hypothetical protein
VLITERDGVPVYLQNLADVREESIRGLSKWA